MVGHGLAALRRQSAVMVAAVGGGTAAALASASASAATQQGSVSSVSSVPGCLDGWDDAAVLQRKGKGPHTFTQI